MKTLLSMRDAIEHPDIFGKILPGESWASWRILLIAAMGLSRPGQSGEEVRDKPVER